MLALGRTAAAVLVFGVLASAGSAQPGARSELSDTKLVYAHGKRALVHPVSPGRRGRVVLVPAPKLRHRGLALGYGVAVEGGLPVDPLEFGRTVERVLGDSRGWGGDRTQFRRVSSGSTSFLVVLASASLTDTLCDGIQTNGRFSCAVGSRAILNFRRWQHGADSYRGQLRAYRIYMVNHEVGHVLGHGHDLCPAAGRRAPVMMQQTKGVGVCRPNPWPLHRERAGAP